MARVVMASAAAGRLETVAAVDEAQEMEATAEAEACAAAVDAAVAEEAAAAIAAAAAAATMAPVAAARAECSRPADGAVGTRRVAPDRNARQRVARGRLPSGVCGRPYGCTIHPVEPTCTGCTCWGRHPARTERLPRVPLWPPTGLTHSCRRTCRPKGNRQSVTQLTRIHGPTSPERPHERQSRRRSQPPRRTDGATDRAMSGDRSSYKWGGRPCTRVGLAR